MTPKFFGGFMYSVATIPVYRYVSVFHARANGEAAALLLSSPHLLFPPFPTPFPPPPSFLSPSPLPFLSSSIFSNFSLFLVIYFPPSLLARALFLEQRKKCISAERGRSMKILRQRAWAGSRYSRSSQLSSSRICEAETRRDRGATRRRNASEFCGTY